MHIHIYTYTHTHTCIKYRSRSKLVSVTSTTTRDSSYTSLRMALVRLALFLQNACIYMRVCVCGIFRVVKLVSVTCTTTRDSSYTSPRMALVRLALFLQNDMRVYVCVHIFGIFRVVKLVSVTCTTTHNSSYTIRNTTGWPWSDSHCFSRMCIYTCVCVHACVCMRTYLRDFQSGLFFAFFAYSVLIFLEIFRTQGRYFRHESWNFLSLELVILAWKKWTRMKNGHAWTGQTWTEYFGWECT
jgi:hypothetical protein